MACQAYHRGNAPVRNALSFEPTGNRFSITSDGVRSLVTDEGQIVPPRWTAMQPFALPILLALFSALVLPAVAAFVQRLVAWLGGRR